MMIKCDECHKEVDETTLTEYTIGTRIIRSCSICYTEGGTLPG